MTERGANAGGGLVGVLEIGGTHFTAALVTRCADVLVPGGVQRRDLNAAASADDLLGEFARAMAAVEAPPDAPWAIAIPGPFDYPRGIGLFKGVGKFDTLLGVDVGSRLHAALPHLTGALTFVNDADAFAVGEWRQGVAAGAARCVGITLGTGIGSAFLEHGVPVTDGPTVPPEGRLHRLKIGNADLEDVVSRRAILARYLSDPEVTRSPGLDLDELFTRSRRGDDWATRVLEDALYALGGALAPWLARFEATVVAVGGGMTGSWDLAGPPLCRGLISAGARTDLKVLPSASSERSSLVGAASYTRLAPL